ncbi:MAG TPA: hypothetical protein ENJ39_05610 [Flammeovirgaceae bacterium]|nr:hypothetical protein [Flammeovirgaceae bacterium]
MKRISGKEEELIEKILRSDSMETPSDNFTARVMQRVEQAASPSLYQPLIPARVWLLASVFLAVLLGIGLYRGEPLTGQPDNPLIIDLVNKVIFYTDKLYQFFNLQWVLFVALLAFTLFTLIMLILSFKGDFWFNRKSIA